MAKKANWMSKAARAADPSDTAFRSFDTLTMRMENGQLHPRAEQALGPAQNALRNVINRREKLAGPVGGFGAAVRSAKALGIKPPSADAGSGSDTFERSRRDARTGREIKETVKKRKQ